MRRGPVTVTGPPGSDRATWPQSWERPLKPRADESCNTRKMSHHKAGTRTSSFDSSRSGTSMKDILHHIYTGELRDRVQSASFDRQPKNASGYIGGRTLSDESAGTRVTKTSAQVQKRRKSISTGFVSSERDLLSRRATTSGGKAPGPALVQSKSVAHPVSKRGIQTKPPPLTVEEIQEMHRDLMRIFREGVASKTLVQVASSSPLAHHEKLSPRLGTAGASERPSPSEGRLAVLLQIGVLLINICWGVLCLPVTMAKAVISDEPPWGDPSPDSTARPAPKLASTLSGSSSVWWTICDVLDSMCDDWTPS